MAAFIGALGSAALQDAKNKAMNKPVGQAIMGGMNRYRNGQTAANTTMDDQQTAADGLQMPQAQDDGYTMPEPMAHGQMVMKPTVALLAEHGQPEMVVPMNADPNNKVSMPSVPGMRLPMAPHPRYRR